jgi:hypothetical protein
MLPTLGRQFNRPQQRGVSLQATLCRYQVAVTLSTFLHLQARRLGPIIRRDPL